MLSAIYHYLASSRQAEADTLLMGSQLSTQSEVLIRPLVLSSDRVSLNYLLNALTQLEHIAGIEVKDAKGFVIARSGHTSSLKLQTRLQLQEQIIGSSTLWLDSKPARQHLYTQIWPIAAIALLTIIVALLTLWVGCGQVANANAESNPDDDHAKDTQGTTDTPVTEHAPLSESPGENFSEALAANLPPEHKPHPNTDTVSESSPVKSATLAASTKENSTLNENKDVLQTSSLVDLLKPEQSEAPSMPKFEHQPHNLHAEETAESEPDGQLVIQEEAITEPLTASTPESNTENPLFKALQERDEVQLGLYSFEHELELILAPQDAIYIFYIDSQTASSENLPPDERTTLLNVYHHLAKQVAHIYNGSVALQDNSDIVLSFAQRDANDSHGVNAICAAILFNLLYKGFNQSRIRGFHPVLSLQMSLTRGHYNKFDMIKEEAHFLTRTTSSNEVISHTALTEAPKLKEIMLGSADIRREDEDKVFLLKVTPKHQILLQKQANHLLSRIFAKKQTPPGNDTADNTK